MRLSIIFAAALLPHALAQPPCAAPASPPIPAALRGVAVSQYTQNISVTVCDAPGCAGTCAVLAADIPLTRTCVATSSPSYFLTAYTSLEGAPTGAATVSVHTDAACTTAAVGELTAISLAGARGCVATGAGGPGAGPLGASAFALGTVGRTFTVDESSDTDFYATIGYVQRYCYAATVALSGAPVGSVAVAGQLVDTYLSGSGVFDLRIWSARWRALLLSGGVDLFTNSSFATGGPVVYGDAPPPGFIGSAPFDPAVPPVITSPVTGTFVPGDAAVLCDAARGELLPAILRGQGALSAPSSYLFLGPTGFHLASGHTPRGAGQAAPWSFSSGYCIQAVAPTAAPANTWQVTVGGAGIGAAPQGCFYAGRDGDDLYYYALSSDGQRQDAPRPFSAGLSRACAATPDDSGLPYIARGFFLAPSASPSPTPTPSASSSPAAPGPSFTATITASPQPAPAAWTCPPLSTGALPAALAGAGDTLVSDGPGRPLRAVRFSLAGSQMTEFNVSGGSAQGRCLDSAVAVGGGVWVLEHVYYYDATTAYRSCYLVAPPVPPATNASYDIRFLIGSGNCTRQFAPGTRPSENNITSWVSGAAAAADAASCPAIPSWPPYIAGRGLLYGGAAMMVLGGGTASVLQVGLSGTNIVSLLCAASVTALSNNTWRVQGAPGSTFGCALIQRNVDDVLFWGNSSAVGCPSTAAAWSGALAPSISGPSFFQSPAGAAVQPAVLPPGASPSTTNSASPFYTATGTPSPMPAPGAWACPPLQGAALPTTVVGTGTYTSPDTGAVSVVSITAARGIVIFNATGAGGTATCPSSAAPFGGGALLEIARPQLQPSGLSPNVYACYLATPPAAAGGTLTLTFSISESASCAQQFAAAPSGSSSISIANWQPQADAAREAATCGASRPGIPAYLQGRGVVTPNTTDLVLQVHGEREIILYGVAARTATFICPSEVTAAVNNTFVVRYSGTNGDVCAVMQRVVDALYVWQAASGNCPNVTEALSGALAPFNLYALFFQSPRGAAAVEPSLAPGASRSSTNSYTPPPAASPCTTCAPGATGASGAADVGAAVGGVIGGLVLVGAGVGAALFFSRSLARARLAGAGGSGLVGAGGVVSSGAFVVIKNPTSYSGTGYS